MEGLAVTQRANNPHGQRCRLELPRLEVEATRGVGTERLRTRGRLVGANSRSRNRTVHQNESGAPWAPD